AMSAYDLCGVQTQSDVANILRCLQESAGGRMLPDGRIRVAGHPITIAALPVGINVADFADHDGAKPRLRSPSSRAANVTRVLGVDRLDYAKGLPQKFQAFSRLLENYPRFRGKV